MRRRILAVMLGVLVGVGAATFHQAEGLSYLSTDPAACTNCHIMQREYDSWLKGSHHTAAGCVDCHLPAEGLSKYAAKALNGFNHSKAFTLGGFHEPIQITERNAEILQTNCLRCHGDLVDDLVHGASRDPDSIRCVHCHRAVGHGELVGLGGPAREGEGGGR
jgi:cytochrome c nitrite reductase small subunit